METVATQSNLSDIILFASNIEKVGIIGILATMLCVMTYFYMKELKNNSATLREIQNDIKDLIKEVRDQNARFIEMLKDAFNARH